MGRYPTQCLEPVPKAVDQILTTMRFSSRIEKYYVNTGDELSCQFFCKIQSDIGVPNTALLST